MLLSAHTDGLDVCRDGLGPAQRLANGFSSRIAPGVRMLLLCSGRQIRDQIIRLNPSPQDISSVGIHSHGFGGLCSAINADKQSAHDARLNVVIPAGKRGT